MNLPAWLINTLLRTLYELAFEVFRRAVVLSYSMLAIKISADRSEVVGFWLNHTQ
jgi:hypothetical protein